MCDVDCISEEGYLQIIMLSIVLVCKGERLGKENQILSEELKQFLAPLLFLHDF